MGEPKIQLSGHSRSRIQERGLSDDDVISTIKSGRKRRTRKGEHGGWVFNYRKEFHGKTLFVCAEEVKSGKNLTIHVITAFIE